MWSMSIRLRMTEPPVPQHAVRSPRNRSGYCWRFLIEPETVAFAYLRERLYCEQRVGGRDLWLSRDMRRVTPGERRSRAL